MVRDPSGTYWCQACDHTASRRQDMFRHVERKHHSQGYRCTYCSSEFRARDQLLKHLRFVHGASTANPGNSSGSSSSNSSFGKKRQQQQLF